MAKSSKVSQISHFYRQWLACILLYLCLPTAALASVVNLPPELLNQIEQQHGIDAKTRILQWEMLINNNQHEPDLVKLRMVNEFFNKMKYISNDKQYGVPDYWATPLEFLINAEGDCKAFALSKYFTLRAMGVSVDKLRLSYVKATQLNQAHMVVTYYETPSTDDPFILDNLRSLILYATERPDLRPIYSFNGDGMWLTSTLKAQGGKRVGDSSKVIIWTDLKKRMAVQGLNLD